MNELRNKELGSKLRLIRKKQNNMTIKDFAKHFGYSEGQLGEMERGRRKITYEFMERVCNEFNEDIFKIWGMNEKIDVTIDKDSSAFYLENSLLIDYLESIGFDVEYLPVSSSAPNTKDGSCSILFQVNIFKNGDPIRCMNLNEWKEFQKKLKTSISLILW